MADAAHGRLLHIGGGAGQQARHGVIEFAQGGRLHAVQRGDTQQHVVLQAFAEVLHDLAGMVELEVDQDGGDDLRVFVADQVGHGGRVHPLEAFDAGGVAAVHDARDQVGGAVVAERLGQHGLDQLVVHGDGRALAGDFLELVDARPRRARAART